MSALIAMAVILGVLLLTLVSGHIYERGREAGRKEQRQIINRAAEKLRQQGVAAQRNIDYLYEQAKWSIYHRSHDDGEPRE